MARRISREFYFPGGDRDDVEQEALIALWIASRDYEPDRGTFKAFATLVIRRRLASCLKTAGRDKHRPLNLSVRTMVDPDGGETRPIAEILPHLHQVVDVAEGREQLALLTAAIETDLTDFERECVLGIASGYDYLDLGPYKKVDNALFRARKKLRRALAH